LVNSERKNYCHIIINYYGRGNYTHKEKIVTFLFLYVLKFIQFFRSKLMDLVKNASIIPDQVLLSLAANRAARPSWSNERFDW
jgi:hypothetical protein